MSRGFLVLYLSVLGVPGLPVLMSSLEGEPDSKENGGGGDGGADGDGNDDSDCL